MFLKLLLTKLYFEVEETEKDQQHQSAEAPPITCHGSAKCYKHTSTQCNKINKVLSKD